MTESQIEAPPADGDTNKDKAPPIPSRDRHVDGGWGWCVVFGYFVQEFFTSTVMRCFTLVYVQLLDRFKQSDTATSTLMTIFATCYFASSKCLHCCLIDQSMQHYIHISNRDSIPYPTLIIHPRISL